MPRKSKPKFLLSFIEEGILNVDYAGFIGGRLEISKDGDYPECEVRFMTRKVEAFRVFREKWDMKEVGLGRRRTIEAILQGHFQEDL